MKFRSIYGYMAAVFLLILWPIIACSCIPKQVALDESYSGQEIEIADGGVLIVTLKATSCSDWKLISISNQNVIKVLGQEVELPAVDDKDIVFSPMCGPERKVIWSFKATKRGNCLLEMGLVNNDRLDYTLKDFSLSILVR